MAALIIADRKSEMSAREDGQMPSRHFQPVLNELDQLASLIEVMAGRVSQLNSHLAKLP